MSEVLLESNIGALFTIIPDPICNIKEWKILDFTSETEILKSDVIAIRTFQVGRTDPMMPLRFNNTLSSNGEEQFNFKLKVYIKDSLSLATSYNFVDVASLSFKVFLGCYRSKLVGLKPPASPLSSMKNVTVIHNPALNLFQVQLSSTTSVSKTGIIDL